MLIAEVKRRLVVEVDILQRVMERKLNLFWHVCRKKGKRLIKNCDVRYHGRYKQAKKTNEKMAIDDTRIVQMYSVYMLQ